MNSSWFIELKFNDVERSFHQYRIQNNLLNLGPSISAKIGPQHVALVDEFVLSFEQTIYEKFDPLSMEDEEKGYLEKMKKYFCEKCSFLNQLISCYAANLTDNEVQIYFYRKMIRLINEMVSGKRGVSKVREMALAN